MFKNNATDNIQNIDLDNEGGGGIRQLQGNQAIIIAVFAIGLSVFAIYSNSFMNMQEIYRNTIFLGFIFVLGFLLNPATKTGNKHKFSRFDMVFAFAGLAGVIYIIMNYTAIHNDRMSQPIVMDYVFGVITIIALLEVARRSIGIFIPILTLGAIVYALFGPYFPGILGHAGFSLERLLFRFYMTTEGLFGMTLSIATTYIVLFILFGAFLNASGATRLFNDLAVAIAGQRRGGPAQVAVLSSALTGSLSGSAVANVATTGPFTIPLMKNIGLRPRFAAAVEASASTGGMIMPPIMGAAAFIMAGFLGVSYNVIIIAAIIPALLYYAGLIIAIDIEAKKQGLKGMSKDSIPQVWAVLKEGGILLVPLVIVIGTLLSGRTPIAAGFAGIIACIIASWLTKDKGNRISIKKAANALIDGAKGSIQVAIACTSVGIIIAVVTMTGLGATLSYNIIDLSGGVLAIILVLVMITCIILSMGLPSTALYIVVAVTAAPALVDAGVNPIAAHFFVFWFGALSNITPPVALASYTAAGLSGADPMKTSWTALKLCLPGFIIPFMIAYNPIMVMQTETGEVASALSGIMVFITALLGVYALSIAVFNFFHSKLNIIERIGFFAAALLLINPGLLTDLIGLAIGIVFLTLHIIHSKRLKTVPSHEDKAVKV
ncbi:TRAP transporter permease [Virgibacillus sp. SK37]|uniref:TRAP transporter permease n=1 Tax=Virgibacillus sp. SK37 TaxID=403957 RepID=UPI0011A489A5|nr:TRAP transporter permease [Virgibacillus sp. SK37]